MRKLLLSKLLQVNIYFNILLTTFLLSSCDCERDNSCNQEKIKYTVSGRIIDFSNGNTFSGHVITFRHSVTQTFPRVRQIDKILGNTIIDSQGYFTFDYLETPDVFGNRELYLELDTSIFAFERWMPLPIYESFNQEFNLSTMSGLRMHFSRPLLQNEKLLFRYGYLYEILGPRNAGFQSLMKVPNENFGPNITYGIDSISSTSPSIVSYAPSGDPKIDSVYLNF